MRGRKEADPVPWGGTPPAPSAGCGAGRNAPPRKRPTNAQGWQPCGLSCCMLPPSFLINRSHSAKPSELASAPAYSRFSPPTGVPPSLRSVSVPCASVFTAKLEVRTAKAARLCTFPHGSAGLRTFLRFSVPSSLHAFSRKWTSSFRIPRNPFKARRIHPELPILHLSAHVRRKTG